MPSQKLPMETYFGMVRTPSDAIKLFEACRVGYLPRVQRRLSERERQEIRSGSVFVWNEREAGMRRWTDGKSWSASRVSGSFLTYREMEGKRGGGGFGRRVSGKTPDSRGSDEDEEPEGYKYKLDGLMKQSFSITTSAGEHLHLISYYSRPGPGQPDLLQPMRDGSLRHIIPIKGLYPESSMADDTPILPSRSMSMRHHHDSHYHHAPPPPPINTGHHGYPHYVQHGQHGQPGYGWPITPPFSQHYTTGPIYVHPAHAHPHAHAQAHAQAQAQAQAQAHAHAHAQGPPAHYSRPSPPPPNYYAGPPQHSSVAPPYQGQASAPHPAQYERPTLPPPQSQPSQPSQPQRAASPVRSPCETYATYSPHDASPRSYHQSASVLPPVHNTSPRSHPVLPSVSQNVQLPALNTTLHAPAPSVQRPSSRSAALTPPNSNNSSSTPPPPSTHNTHASSGGPSKTSLAALVHPTPNNSEPNSAQTASVGSASSSPRHPVATLAGTAAAAVAALGASVPSGQQYLQPAPSGEDTRVLGRLDRRFRI